MKIPAYIKVGGHLYRKADEDFSAKLRQIDKSLGTAHREISNLLNGLHKAGETSSPEYAMAELMEKLVMTATALAAGDKSYLSSVVPTLPSRLEALLAALKDE